MTTSQRTSGRESDTPDREGLVAPEPSTSDVLNYVLERAAHAHHFHELELGGPHPDWAPWYAVHMAETLADHGYQLVLAPSRGGIDVTADPKEGVAEEAAQRRDAVRDH
jgi:hypothetical protein